MDDSICIFLSYGTLVVHILGQRWLLSNYFCKACQNCFRPRFEFVHCGCMNCCFAGKAPANAIMQANNANDCAVIHGQIWMNNVPSESRIIMLSYTEISSVICFFWRNWSQTRVSFFIFTLDSTRGKHTSVTSGKVIGTCLKFPAIITSYSGLRFPHFTFHIKRITPCSFILSVAFPIFIEVYIYSNNHVSLARDNTVSKPQSPAQPITW